MRLTQQWLGYGLLILLSLHACSSDDPKKLVDAGPDASELPPETMGNVGDGGFWVADAGGMDASVDAGPAIDASACVPLGCDELGYECGKGMDNCGNEINCDLASGLSPCEPPLRCGGDPDKGTNKCGCKMRADACAAQGAQCGLIEECGQTVACGDCPNGARCLGANQCACTPNSDPCAGKVCGSADDGCGHSVTCGGSGGACTIGVCDANGQCACRSKAEACAGRTDSFTESGCTYDCAATGCVPDNAAACQGAECGTAINNCGDTVNCGAAGGACAAGNACVPPQRVADGALPPQTGAYKGGYCVPTNVANMLGKYAVRSHAFQQAGASGQTLMSRLEIVQFFSVKYMRATGRAQLTEQGCSAASVSRPGERASATGLVPNIRKLPVITADLTISGAQWSRGDPPHPQLGSGRPAGWEPGIPSFCQGYEGQVVDLPAGDSRRGQPGWWSDNRCKCPTAANQYQVPGPDNYTTSLLSDCRIVDGDFDGLPGVTASGTATYLITLSNDVYSVGIGHGVVSGAIRDDRFHVGQSGEAVKPPPATSVAVACSNRNELCAAPEVNCGCPENLQPVQFVPLADEDPLDCNIFGTSTKPDQVGIDKRFAVPFGTCSGAGQCPAGSLCRGGQCFTVSSKGACTTSSNPAPASGFTEDCPTGMECKSDAACWPTNSACPATPNTNGQLCKP